MNRSVQTLAPTGLETDFTQKVYCCYEVVWARNGYYFGLFWLSVIILAHVPKLLKIVALEIKKSFFKKRKKLVINELPCRNVMYQIFGRLSVFMIYNSFLIPKFRGGGGSYF